MVLVNNTIRTSTALFAYKLQKCNLDTYICMYYVRHANTYSVRMKVFDHRCNYIHDTSGLAFWEKLLLENLVQEFSTAHEFRDQVDVLAVLKSIPQGDNVWVLSMPKQNFNFFFTISFALVYDLKRVWRSCLVNKSRGLKGALKFLTFY